MTKLSKIVSATIVAFWVLIWLLWINPVAWSKPLDTLPDQSPGREETQPKLQDENMAISEPGELVKKAPNAKVEYFSHRQAFTLRLGAATPADDLDEKETIVGFAYMFPRFLSPRFEAGADVHNKDDKGHVHAGIRKIYLERNAIRPSLKMAVSHEVHSDEGLATFANNKHYFGRGSAALDISYDQDWSIRLEIEGLVGIEKNWVAASLGLSRCW